MPQFAVYRYPGQNPHIPFVVQVQSSRLDRNAGRVVMALVRVGPKSSRDHALTPHLAVQGESVYANPLNMTSLMAGRLTNVLEVLSEHAQDRIILAIDARISRA